MTEGEETMVNLFVKLPESKRDKLKAHAFFAGKDMRELVEEYIDTLPEPPTLPKNKRQTARQAKADTEK